MNKPMRLTFQKGDLIAVAAVVLLIVLSAVLWLPKNSADPDALVQIYLDGRLTDELPLSEDTTVKVTGQYSNTVEISGGTVSVTASNCPGGDCMHSGKISHSGRSIVCLPNRVEVRIVGNDDDVDFIVG